MRCQVAEEPSREKREERQHIEENKGKRGERTRLLDHADEAVVLRRLPAMFRISTAETITIDGNRDKRRTCSKESHT
jgi:hypothetical protein